MKQSVRRNILLASALITFGSLATFVDVKVVKEHSQPDGNVFKMKTDTWCVKSLVKFFVQLFLPQTPKGA